LCCTDTIPVAHHVDINIVQDGKDGASPISYTWTDYRFGQFSDWVNVFRPGTGTITIWENVGGARSAQPLYRLHGIALTPGPLLVVIKVAGSQAANTSGFWPPALPDSIETVAASYVQSDTFSKVRLPNLSPDTRSAGMTCSANGSAEIVSGVAFSLGSRWVGDKPSPRSTDRNAALN
jgi:hypothetical protein